MSSFSGGKLPNRSPENKNEWGILLIVGFFFIVLILAEIIVDFSTAKLSIPFFFLSWIPLLIIHEFGHALMAKFLGWRVELISIGIGKLRASLEVLGMPVEIRTFPISGFASPRATDMIRPRLKNFLIYAAGPGIEILCVLVMVSIFGYSTLTTRTADPGIIAAQSFCAAALFGIFITLFPISHETERGESWSDGLGMILCWRLPDEYFADQAYRD